MSFNELGQSTVWDYFQFAPNQVEIPDWRNWKTWQRLSSRCESEQTPSPLCRSLGSLLNSAYAAATLVSTMFTGFTITTISLGSDPAVMPLWCQGSEVGMGKLVEDRRKATGTQITSGYKQVLQMNFFFFLVTSKALLVKWHCECWVQTSMQYFTLEADYEHCTHICGNQSSQWLENKTQVV